MPEGVEGTAPAPAAQGPYERLARIGRASWWVLGILLLVILAVVGLATGVIDARAIVREYRESGPAPAGAAAAAAVGGQAVSAAGDGAQGAASGST